MNTNAAHDRYKPGPSETMIPRLPCMSALADLRRSLLITCNLPTNTVQMLDPIRSHRLPAEEKTVQRIFVLIFDQIVLSDLSARQINNRCE